MKTPCKEQSTDIYYWVLLSVVGRLSHYYYHMSLTALVPFTRH